MFSQVFNKHFYSRVAPWAVLAAVVSVPLLVYGVRGALRGGDNDVRQWLPRGFRETQEYDRFLAQFGSEEMAVMRGMMDVISQKLTCEVKALAAKQKAKK